jgi:hypothetical protein
VAFKEYTTAKAEAIAAEKMVGSSYSVAAFERMAKNWQVQRVVSR